MVKYISLLVLIINIFFACEEKSKAVKKTNDKDYKHSNEEYLNKLTNNMFAKDASKHIKGKKDKQLDDSSWIILINNHKIAKKEFENSYNRFIRQAGIRIPKEKFLNFFLLNYSIKKKANAYFSSRKKLLKFVRTQAVIREYLKTFISKRKIKKPSYEKLKQFYSVLIREKGFRHLNFKKDKKKIRLLYKNQKLNQEYAFLEQKLIGKFRVIKNDEWENGIIEKYINNKINLKKALASKYKEYWLFRIVTKKPSNKRTNNNLKNKSSKYIIKQAYYVKDVENKIKMLGLSGLNPLLVKKFRRNINVRKMIINSFLTEILAYNLLKKTRMLYNKSYRKVAYNAEQNFMINYYIKNVLKLRTESAKQEYIWNFINNNKITLNKGYFYNSKP